jgi:hypothetical protein
MNLENKDSLAALWQNSVIGAARPEFLRPGEGHEG